MTRKDPVVKVSAGSLIRFAATVLAAARPRYDAGVAGAGGAPKRATTQIRKVWAKAK